MTLGNKSNADRICWKKAKLSAKTVSFPGAAQKFPHSPAAEESSSALRACPLISHSSAIVVWHYCIQLSYALYIEIAPRQLAPDGSAVYASADHAEYKHDLKMSPTCWLMPIEVNKLADKS